MNSWQDTLGNTAKKAEPPPRGAPSADPKTFERARAYVATMDPAISGQGGHLATWKVARKCAADFGLTERDTLEILREFNQRCEPRWSDRDLQHKAHDAATKAHTAKSMDEERHWQMPRAHYSTGTSIGTPPPDDDAPTDADDPRAPVPHSATPQDTPRISTTVLDVLEQWRTEGQLVHEPTGIDVLDTATGGGPVYGTRWYFVGAPDAGKTALLVQIGHSMAERGVAVGILAVDEEPTDLVTRLAQRCGWLRQDCEARYVDAVDAMQAKLATLPIRFYGDGTTIEGAASDLATWARERVEAAPETHPHGARALLLVDSLQTVSCDREVLQLAGGGRELSLREAVTERARALRTVATRYRLIAISTSEMNRNAYRSEDAAKNANDLASAAESRAVEYSGRVLLALRSVPDEKDLVEVRLPKNKHRPSGCDTTAFHLRIDRASQWLSEATYDPPPVGDRTDKAMRQVAVDAVMLARVLFENPGMGVRDLRAEFRSRSGAGVERTEAALKRLGSAVVTRSGPRGAKLMSIDVALLPDEVRAELRGDL